MSFRETNDTGVLSRAQNDVQTYFNITGFTPTYVVIVTWFEVVQFGGSSLVGYLISFNTITVYSPQFKVPFQS